MNRVDLRPDRTALAAVIVLFLGSLPLGLASPLLAPVFLVPLAALVWVLRARVSADSQRIEVCNGLLVRRVPWTAVDRFEVQQRGPVVLHELDGRTTRLTALPKRSLPQLLAVSQAEPASP